MNGKLKSEYLFCNNVKCLKYKRKNMKVKTLKINDFKFY